MTKLQTREVELIVCSKFKFSLSFIAGLCLHKVRAESTVWKSTPTGVLKALNSIPSAYKYIINGESCIFSGMVEGEEDYHQGDLLEMLLLNKVTQLNAERGGELRGGGLARITWVTECHISKINL